MKKFLKTIISFAALIATAIGALSILDRLYNKNRIKGDYLNCHSQNEDE